MNPVPYITAFAWLSITALSFAIIQSFWVSILIAAIAIVVLVRLIR